MEWLFVMTKKETENTRYAVHTQLMSNYTKEINTSSIGYETTVTNLAE